MAFDCRGSALRTKVTLSLSASSLPTFLEKPMTQPEQHSRIRVNQHAPGTTAVTRLRVPRRTRVWAVSLCIAALTLAACGGSDDDNAEPTDVDLAVSLVYPGASTGQATWVSSQPAGIDCGLRCINRYALDSLVTLTATAPSGLRFSGWSGACSGAVATCTVRMSGARTVTATFVAMPQVGGWSDAAVLSAAGAGRPRVGIDAAGRATAVWLQNDPASSRRSVWTSHKTSGGEWSVPALLESSDTDFFDVELAVDASSGRIMAVWRGATSPEVFARAADATGVWGTAARINGPGSNINDLQVGIDANGNAVAVWSQTPTGSTVTSVWSNRTGSGGAWQGALQVAVAENDRQDLDPSLAVSANGRAFVVWTRNGSGVLASQAGPALPWSTPSLLAAGAVSTGVAAPRVAADANGNAMAVWAQGARNASNQVETTLAAKRFASGAWQANATVLYTPVITPSLGEVRLSANGAGQFAAIWAQADTSIRAAQTDAAGTWRGAAVVRPSGTELFGFPQVGLDSSSNLFATWVQRATASTGTPELWLNRSAASSGWLQATVHQTTSDASGDQRIAMNDRGHAVIVWVQNSSAGSRVIRRHFTPAP